MIDFDDLESEKEKIQFLRDLLNTIAEKTSGKLRLVPKEDEIHCRGQLENREFQLVMDTSTGGLNIELTLRNTVGLLRLNYDPEAEISDEESDSAWGEDKSTEIRYFLAPYYYLEEYPDALAMERKVLESLEPAEVEIITVLMSKFGIGWINANSGTLTAGFFESLFDAGEILNIVGALHRLALQFEKEGAQIEPAPSWTIGGVEVNPQLFAALQICPFCKSKVSLKPDRKCPNCGASM